MKKYQNAPFALVGVNFDQDRGTVRDLYDKGAVTWRSFLEGAPSRDSQTLINYRVESFPTVLLIDHHGVIRHEGLFGSDLDQAIDRLLAQTPKS